ncbi:MAG: sortase [Candidatus Dojkabacteria bacterium]
MKHKGIIAIFTLLMIILGISAIAVVLSIRNRNTDQTVSVDTTLPQIQVQTAISYIHNNPDGSTEIKYTYTLKNISGTYNIESLVAQSDLTATFSPHSFSIVNLSSDSLNVNSTYNGTSDQELLNGNDTLGIGQSVQIFLVVNFVPGDDVGPFENNVTASGDITRPDTSTSNTSSGGSSSGDSNTTGTPPGTSTDGGSDTGGDDSGSTTEGGGGTTIGEEPPGEPISRPHHGGGSHSSTGSTPPSNSGGSSSNGSSNTTTGGSTSGGSPNVNGTAQVSFTLSASGGAPIITQPSLPNTSGSLRYQGLGFLYYTREWIDDNVLKLERNKVRINKIGVDAEILEGQNEEVLESGLWRMPQTSNPEEGGNMVIAGHRFLRTYSPQTFYKLDQVQVGDEIEVIWNNKKYIYIVKETKEILSTDLSILDDKKNTLTLFTCISQTDSSKRLVVRAELKE